MAKHKETGSNLVHDLKSIRELLARHVLFVWSLQPFKQDLDVWCARVTANGQDVQIWCCSACLAVLGIAVLCFAAKCIMHSAQWTDMHNSRHDNLPWWDCRPLCPVLYDQQQSCASVWAAESSNSNSPGANGHDWQQSWLSAARNTRIPDCPCISAGKAASILCLFMGRQRCSHVDPQHMAMSWFLNTSTYASRTGLQGNWNAAQLVQGIGQEVAAFGASLYEGLHKAA